MSDTAAGLLTVLGLVVVLGVTHVPLGDYMARVYSSTKHWRGEQLVYGACRIDPEADQTWPTYALSVVLFALLVFTGLGSLASERLRDRRAGLVAALATVTALVVIAAFVLQPLLRALIELPFAVRVVLAVVLLAPAGFLMGTAMPIGLKRLAGLHPTGVAWAWGINGVTSVLGSVLAIFVALNWGFTVATLVAAACYAAAAGHARLGRWP